MPDKGKSRYTEIMVGHGIFWMVESPKGCAKSFVLYFVGQLGLNNRAALLWSPLRYRMDSQPRYNVILLTLSRHTHTHTPTPTPTPTPTHPPTPRGYEKMNLSHSEAFWAEQVPK